MCLIALALDRHQRWPLVIAANRDEFTHRPSAALDWWPPAADAEPVLAGRDLQAGGTWMGLNAKGRIGLLTNVRDPVRLSPSAPSRGAIVTRWLHSRQGADDFWPGVAAAGHNPFNLLAGDLVQDHWWWVDDRTAAPRRLGPGVYGLSNAALDTPWPKVQRLKAALADALESAVSPDALEDRLFTALACRESPADGALPDTGVGLDRERLLAPAFIRTPDARYGTRCSTLLIVERDARQRCATMIERQFDAAGRAIGQRRAKLPSWPLAAGQLPGVIDDAISAG